MTNPIPSEIPADPITRWRQSHERDLESFVRSHGRRPDSLDELSRWLKPPPIRTEHPQR